MVLCSTRLNLNQRRTMTALQVGFLIQRVFKIEIARSSTLTSVGLTRACTLIVMYRKGTVGMKEGIHNKLLTVPKRYSYLHLYFVFVQCYNFYDITCVKAKIETMREIEHTQRTTWNIHECQENDWCDITCENVAYWSTNIVGPDQTPRMMRGVWSEPTIFATHEHLQKTCVSRSVQC